ncbi:hypothetical protein ILYODFUR_018931 [Ilyodon furcidens]|uniref:Uncharacterized protein n=1 Tax=Ilyodon furcidens TaxID=33524 RepID=A0ABV0T1Z2_9TELE
MKFRTTRLKYFKIFLVVGEIHSETQLLQLVSEISLEETPAAFKYFLRQHCGYPVETMNSRTVTDDTKKVHENCKPNLDIWKFGSTCKDDTEGTKNTKKCLGTYSFHSKYLGFKWFLSTLEPKYTTPSPVHVFFCIKNLYKECTMLT